MHYHTTHPCQLDIDRQANAAWMALIFDNNSVIVSYHTYRYFRHWYSPTTLSWYWPTSHSLVAYLFASVNCCLLL